jgi:lambda repressor-like predicted transcriptional regulator
MTDQTTAQDRRSETARNNARQQAHRTLERLTVGIAALAKAGTPITAKTVEAQTGLSYRTITRNPEAYALFCKHAAYFQPKPRARTTRNTGSTNHGKRKASGWDPLLGRPKRQLVNRARAAEQRARELEQALITSALQQQELARRNLALEAELAQTTRRLAYLVAEHRGGPA